MTQSEIWSAVQATQQRESCRDALRPGMEREELIALAPRSCTMPGYACPAVSQYLRLIKATPMEDDQ